MFIVPIGIHGMKTVQGKEKIITKKQSEFSKFILCGRNHRGPNLGILQNRAHTGHAKDSTPPEPDSTHQGSLTEFNNEISKLSMYHVL